MTMVLKRTRAFVPSDLPGLIHDWDADNIAQADASAVSSWPDAVVGGVAAVQATASQQPTLKTNILNGHKVVRFDGAVTNADHILATYPSTLAQPTTVFLVGQTAVDGVARKFFDSPGTTGRNILEMTVGGLWNGFSGTNRTFGTADANWNIHTLVFGANSVARVNGLNKSLAGSFGTTGCDGLDIGNRGTNNLGTKGDIARILVFNRALSNDEIVHVQNYLSKRYAIAIFPQSSRLYVDSVLGNDAAVGNPAAPLLTLGAAISRLPTDGGTIFVTAPEASPLREQVTYTGAGDIEIRSATDGVEWFMYGSEKHTSGWTSLGSGIYSKVLAGYPTAVDSVVVTSLTDGDGDFVVLRPNLATPTTPAAGESGWDNATTTLYVHLAADANPGVHTIEVTKRLFCFVTTGTGQVTLRWLHARGGTNAGIQAGNASGAGKIYAYDCKADYCGDEAGMKLADPGTVFYAERCEANLCTHNDGFSVKGSGTMTLVDCIARKNWEEGFTSHDTTTLHVTRGRSHHNYGSGYEGVTVSANVATFDGTEFDHNNVGGGPSGLGAVTYRTGQTGSVANCNIHDNNLKGICQEAGSTVSFSNNTSGVAAGNAQADCINCGGC